MTKKNEIHRIHIAIDEFYQDISFYDVISSLISLKQETSNIYIGEYNYQDETNYVKVNIDSNCCYLNDEECSIETIIEQYDPSIDVYSYIEKVTGLDVYDYISNVYFSDGRYIECPVKDKTKFIGNYRIIYMSDISDISTINKIYTKLGISAVEPDYNDPNIISYSLNLNKLYKQCSAFSILSSLIVLSSNDDAIYTGYASIYGDEHVIVFNKLNQEIRLDDELITISSLISYLLDEDPIKYIIKTFNLNQTDFIDEIRYKNGMVICRELMNGPWIITQDKRTRYFMFSDMKWLDEEVERNKVSPGRNPSSDQYYYMLQRIRLDQESGKIKDLLYEEFTNGIEDDPIAYGYYTSNIHYDLYKPSHDKDYIEDMIIDFMMNTPADSLKNASYFNSNFITSFVYYLANHIYIDKISGDPIIWIRQNGSKKENQILDLYLQITDSKF